MIGPRDAEGEDTRVALGGAGGQDLEAGLIQEAHEPAEALLDGGRHGRHAHLLQEGEAGLQGVDAQEVGAAALEAGRGGGGGPVVAIVVAGMGDHVPAELAQPQLRPQGWRDVEKGDALRPQHPLMAIRHDDIHGGPL